MRALPIAFAAAAIAVISLACGRDEEAAAPAPTASPTPLSAFPTPAVKGQLWRWVNVTVVIPEGSEVQASPQDASPVLKPPSAGPALQLVYEDPNAGTVSSVLVDAENGEILLEQVREEDRIILDTVLHTVVVAALDPLTAPWPFSGNPPDTAAVRVGELRLLRPGPASGIHLSHGISDSFDPPAGFEWLRITNGRSTTVIDARTGARLESDGTVAPGDKSAFDRLIASIQVCGRDVQC